jgi:uncharacterized protein (UPF0261 family)
LKRKAIMAVLLIGTLDTKGVEFLFVRDFLRATGVEVLVLDAGILRPPAFPPDVTREQVFAAAGENLESLRKSGDRGRAVDAAARGAARVAQDLHRQGRVDGVLSLGGSAGTAIGTAAMRALPFGVPKLMVSTLASGQVRPYVGQSDVCMMYSVVDISGLNRISRRVLANAASAMAGMARGMSTPTTDDDDDRPMIAATMFGVTTPCVEGARARVERAGYETLVFHATGVGGLTMEKFIAEGRIAGVLDLTTTELADELAGGVCSAGGNRLTAAALRGVPQVISLGALDMVNFGAPDSVPEKYRNRLFHVHNSSVTLMRTTPEENDQLGKEIAHKASAAKGPTAVLVPLRGVSALDKKGEPFWNPSADAALFQSLRDWMSPDVELIEYDLHINDPLFAQAAAEKLLLFLRSAEPVRLNGG